MVKKDWCLPKPPKGKQYEWHPVVRIGSHVPFGYTQDQENPDILLPIVSELELLETAKKHLKKYSYREVANWLTKESGRSISHEGLRKRIKLEQKRQRDFANAVLYAERAKEAAEKAEQILKSIGGKYSRTDLTGGEDTSDS